MKDEAHLVRSCKYSGEPEYWVEVLETGEKGQERESKKQRKEISQDADKTPLGPVSTAAIDKMNARTKASQSVGAVSTSEAIRGKSVLSKFCESILTKTAKIRSLVVDLKKNYDDQAATKSIDALQRDLGALEEKYNVCSELLAQGEAQDFNTEWLA
ncbi:unnamed protein product [Cladocopium goreaui]|uniref:Uncharacterized protein n=1 Tax=Cladocopium goreaui TaxID=2562237 RepID=A0A9P1DTG9_9DINO|nr:unnamed protein product [Cladocopium goreaui]